jgi:hypothetical protein
MSARTDGLGSVAIPREGTVVREDGLPLQWVEYNHRYGFLGFRDDKKGDTFLCSCQKNAWNRLSRVLQTDGYPNGVLPKSLRSPDGTAPPRSEDLNFINAICHQCTGLQPTRVCDFRGNPFERRCGWYLELQNLEFGIQPIQLIAPDMRLLPQELRPHYWRRRLAVSHWTKLADSAKYDQNNLTTIEFHQAKREWSNALSNRIRVRFGLPLIGQGWVAEAHLASIVQSIFPDATILRNVRPQWLRGLELDIWIPTLNIAFEYQGIQHYEAVEFFDGKEGLDSRIARDQEKRQLCESHGTMVIEIKYSDPMTVAHVKKRIAAKSSQAL